MELNVTAFDGLDTAGITWVDENDVTTPDTTEVPNVISSPQSPGLPMYMYAILTVYAIIFFVGGLGNIATIVAFALEPKLRVKPSDLIILALAVADAYICVIESPLTFQRKLIGSWILGYVFCRIRYIMLHACLNAGIN